jgi:hypothetical protein
MFTIIFPMYLLYDWKNIFIQYANKVNAPKYGLSQFIYNTYSL